MERIMMDASDDATYGVPRLSTADLPEDGDVLLQQLMQSTPRAFAEDAVRRGKRQIERAALLLLHFGAADGDVDDVAKGGGEPRPRRILHSGRWQAGPPESGASSSSCQAAFTTCNLPCGWTHWDTEERGLTQTPANFEVEVAEVDDMPPPEFHSVHHMDTELSRRCQCFVKAFRWKGAALPVPSCVQKIVVPILYSWVVHWDLLLRSRTVWCDVAYAFIHCVPANPRKAWELPPCTLPWEPLLSLLESITKQPADMLQLSGMNLGQGLPMSQLCRCAAQHFGADALQGVWDRLVPHIRVVESGRGGMFGYFEDLMPVLQLSKEENAPLIRHIVETLLWLPTASPLLGEPVESMTHYKVLGVTVWRVLARIFTSCAPLEFMDEFAERLFTLLSQSLRLHTVTVLAKERGSTQTQLRECQGKVGYLLSQQTDSPLWNHLRRLVHAEQEAIQPTPADDKSSKHAGIILLQVVKAVHAKLVRDALWRRAVAPRCAPTAGLAVASEKTESLPFSSSRSEWTQLTRQAFVGLLAPVFVPAMYGSGLVAQTAASAVKLLVAICPEYMMTHLDKYFVAGFTADVPKRTTVVTLKLLSDCVFAVIAHTKAYDRPDAQEAFAVLWRHVQRAFAAMPEHLCTDDSSKLRSATCLLLQCCAFFPISTLLDQGGAVPSIQFNTFPLVLAQQQSDMGKSACAEEHAFVSAMLERVLSVCRSPSSLSNKEVHLFIGTMRAWFAAMSLTSLEHCVSVIAAQAMDIGTTSQSSAFAGLVCQLALVAPKQVLPRMMPVVVRAVADHAMLASDDDILWFVSILSGMVYGAGTEVLAFQGQVEGCLRVLLDTAKKIARIKAAVKLYAALVAALSSIRCSTASHSHQLDAGGVTSANEPTGEALEMASATRLEWQAPGLVHCNSLADLHRRTVTDAMKRLSDLDEPREGCCSTGAPAVRTAALRPHRRCLTEWLCAVVEIGSPVLAALYSKTEEGLEAAAAPWFVPHRPSMLSVHYATFRGNGCSPTEGHEAASNSNETSDPLAVPQLLEDSTEVTPRSIHRHIVDRLLCHFLADVETRTSRKIPCQGSETGVGPGGVPDEVAEGRIETFPKWLEQVCMEGDAASLARCIATLGVLTGFHPRLEQPFPAAVESFAAPTVACGEFWDSTASRIHQVDELLPGVLWIQRGDRRARSCALGSRAIPCSGQRFAEVVALSLDVASSSAQEAVAASFQWLRHIIRFFDQCGLAALLSEVKLRLGVMSKRVEWLVSSNVREPLNQENRTPACTPRRPPLSDDGSAESVVREPSGKLLAQRAAPSIFNTLILALALARWGWACGFPETILSLMQIIRCIPNGLFSPKLMDRLNGFLRLHTGFLRTTRAEGGVMIRILESLLADAVVIASYSPVKARRWLQLVKAIYYPCTAFLLTDSSVQDLLRLCGNMHLEVSGEAQTVLRAHLYTIKTQIPKLYIRMQPARQLGGYGTGSSTDVYEYRLHYEQVVRACPFFFGVPSRVGDVFPPAILRVDSTGVNEVGGAVSCGVRLRHTMVPRPDTSECAAAQQLVVRHLGVATTGAGATAVESPPVDWVSALLPQHGEFKTFSRKRMALWKALARVVPREVAIPAYLHMADARVSAALSSVPADVHTAEERTSFIVAASELLVAAVRATKRDPVLRAQAMGKMASVAVAICQGVVEAKVFASMEASMQHLPNTLRVEELLDLSGALFAALHNGGDVVEVQGASSPGVLRSSQEIARALKLQVALCEGTAVDFSPPLWVFILGQVIQRPRLLLQSPSHAVQCAAGVLVGSILRRGYRESPFRPEADHLAWRLAAVARGLIASVPLTHSGGVPFIGEGAGAATFLPQQLTALSPHAHLIEVFGPMMSALPSAVLAVALPATVELADCVTRRVQEVDTASQPVSALREAWLRCEPGKPKDAVAAGAAAAAAIAKPGPVLLCHLMEFGAKIATLTGPEGTNHFQGVISGISLNLSGRLPKEVVHEAVEFIGNLVGRAVPATSTEEVPASRVGPTLTVRQEGFPLSPRGYDFLVQALTILARNNSHRIGKYAMLAGLVDAVLIGMQHANMGVRMSSFTLLRSVICIASDGQMAELTKRLLLAQSTSRTRVRTLQAELKALEALPDTAHAGAGQQPTQEEARVRRQLAQLDAERLAVVRALCASLCPRLMVLPSYAPQLMRHLLPLAYDPNTALSKDVRDALSQWWQVHHSVLEFSHVGLFTPEFVAELKNICAASTYFV